MYKNKNEIEKAPRIRLYKVAGNVNVILINVKIISYPSAKKVHSVMVIKVTYLD